MKRGMAGTVAVVVLLAAGGCKDMGLPGNVPTAESEAAPPLPLPAAVHAPAEDGVRLVMEGRLWVPSGQPETRPEAGLRSVGSAAGHTVYARRWDQPPYRTLFTRLPDGRWQGYAAVGR